MASQDTSDLVHTLVSVVRGHHVYKRIWTPTVGERLQLRPEEDKQSESSGRSKARCHHWTSAAKDGRRAARTVWSRNA